MSIADLLGWIGNSFFIIGVIFLARKSKLGFINNFIGNSFYIAQGILLNISSLLLLSIGLCLVNLYGFYKWTTDELKNKRPSNS